MYQVPAFYNTFRRQLQQKNSFEIDFLQWNHWLSGHKYAMCLLALMFPLVFGGQKLMADRKPFQLTYLLLVWNVGMAFFSIYLAV